MPSPPWSQASGVDAVVDSWQRSKRVRPCVTADETLSRQEPSLTAFPGGLHPHLVAALRQRNVNNLYSHQRSAFEAASRGEHVVVATPTASGKSFCFHLPVLNALLADPDARALYLFPTKALSRDQEVNLRALMKDSGVATSAIVYDGDTPGDARRAGRERAGVILTNPDMLHTGILPHHTAWARTLQHLRYIVLDELHTYKGVFGSHVANVIARLMRIAAFHGSKPVIIGATATIGNPKEHAARLFGAPESSINLVDDNGAGRGERRVFVFNPPVVNAELGIRASYVKQAVMLATDLVRAKVPTIVFGQSRNNVEVMLRYLRDAVTKDGLIAPDQVMAYRGGYLPGQRRDIESRLRNGEILGVVATNALELGIDIGELDAVICAGYPGSVASMWQRFGRAGRRNGRSIAVLVTSSAPLDQYLAREPGFLLGAPVEQARIDPHNVEVLVQHLKCAAFELPFRQGETFSNLTADETKDALNYLRDHNVLHENGGTFHWASDAYPASNVSLRSIGWDNVVIIDVERDKSIGELDWRAAHTMLHEQAIYQHDSECFQVEKLDYENHKAFVRKVKPDYYTDAMTYVQVSVLEESDTGKLLDQSWESGWGELAIVEKVIGYKKIKFYTHENTGYGEVRLPEMQMHTTGFWLTIPEAICQRVPEGRAAAIDALRGIGIALETVSTLALMCDPRDLGTTMGDTEIVEDDIKATTPRKIRGGPKPGYSPTLFLYEHTPGGIGLAERIFEEREVLLARALQLIEGCPCVSGCPTCVGPGEQTDFAQTGIAQDARSYSRKSVAINLLRRSDLKAHKQKQRTPESGGAQVIPIRL